jgi:hypothetical protein
MGLPAIATLPAAACNSEGVTIAALAEDGAGDAASGYLLCPVVRLQAGVLQSGVQEMRGAGLMHGLANARAGARYIVGAPVRAALRPPVCLAWPVRHCARSERLPVAGRPLWNRPEFQTAAMCDIPPCSRSLVPDTIHKAGSSEPSRARRRDSPGNSRPIHSDQHSSWHAEPDQPPSRDPPARSAHQAFAATPSPVVQRVPHTQSGTTRRPEEETLWRPA